MPSFQKSHFTVEQQFNSDFSPHKLTEYVSNRTGMRLVVVDQEGPKLHGYFVLATECHDDSGAPHTLEHLCFMGSKNYPYKGLLDKVATRAYSSTNAWTANDHTAYTLETAGTAAFLKVLPVYLEHVIVPTLTDSGCITEVYHIDGEGHDAGVVYSEMQGVQHKPESIMDLQNNRLMYPEGNGFRYETGGLMEALRVLTADRIRTFHKEMYQPKNLCIVVVGEVDHADLLRVLDDFEETILEHVPKLDAPFKRPWVESEQTPPLRTSIVETSLFPEEDESHGTIQISFLGPSCNDTTQYTALTILLVYLAGSSASVLENTLVEKEQIASAVYYYTTPRPDTVIQFSLSGVDASKLSKVHDRFFEVLRETASKELNMPYMRDCIAREKRQQKYYAESVDSFFSTGIIVHFLFDKLGKGSKLQDIASLREIDALEGWTDEQWRQFLRKWLSDAHHISLLGSPSAAMSKQLKEDEEARVAARKERLGVDGLKELERKLEDAKAANGKEIPREMLERFTVHDPKIHFIHTISAKSPTAKDARAPSNSIQSTIDQDQSTVPLYIHYEHVPSNFVQISILISTSQVPVSLRPLLVICSDLFFTSPIMRGGKRIEFEEVVKELERDTVEYEIGTASSLGNGEMISIVMDVEKEKYETGIQWLKDLLWDSVYDVQRIKASLTKLLADIPEEKRSGSSMSSAAAVMLNYEPGSVERACNTLVKALYLKRIRQLLSTDPDAVVGQLEEIRKTLYQTSNFRILVVANIEKLERPVSSWEKLTLGREQSRPLSPLDKKMDRLSKPGLSPGNLAYIIPMHTIDSSFALTVAKGPDDPRDPRIPALQVAISYLNAIEGPMWTAIRGTGLAYGVGLVRRTGHIEYSVYRSPDAYKAFSTGKKVVEDFLSGETSFDSLALEGAISSIILGIADQQTTMVAAGQDSFSTQVIKDLPKNWSDLQLERVRNVTVDEIRQVMQEIILPVFLPQSSNLFVTCAPIMEEAQVRGFSEMGYKPEVQTLAFFQDDYGLKGDGEEEESDGDDESEGDEDEDEESEEEDD